MARSLALSFLLYGKDDGFGAQITDNRTGYHDRLLGLSEPGSRGNSGIHFAPAETLDVAEYRGDIRGDASGPFSLRTESAEGQEGKPVLTGPSCGASCHLPLDQPWAAPGPR
mgnify:FL=1